MPMCCVKSSKILSTLDTTSYNERKQELSKKYIICLLIWKFSRVLNPLTLRVKLWVIQRFLTIDHMDRTLKCDYSLECCWAVLCCGAVVLFDSQSEKTGDTKFSNFWFHVQNPKVWPSLESCWAVPYRDAVCFYNLPTSYLWTTYQFLDSGTVRVKDLHVLIQFSNAYLTPEEKGMKACGERPLDRSSVNLKGSYT